MHKTNIIFKRNESRFHYYLIGMCDQSNTVIFIVESDLNNIYLPITPGIYCQYIN